MLESLSLDDCVEITDASMKTLEKLTALKHLELAFCSKITDIGIHSISNLSNLEALILVGCEKITDKGMKDILKLTILETLDLSGCPITNKSLEILEKHPTLKLLLCPGIIDSERKAFEKALPGCTLWN